MSKHHPTNQLSYSNKTIRKDGQTARPKTFQVIRSFTHECNYNGPSTYTVQAIILGTERSMANIIDTGSSFYVEKQIWNSRKMQIKIVEPVSRLMGGKATSEYFGRLLCKKITWDLNIEKVLDTEQSGRRKGANGYLLPSQISAKHPKELVKGPKAEMTLECSRVRRKTLGSQSGNCSKVRWQQ